MKLSIRCAHLSIILCAFLICYVTIFMMGRSHTGVIIQTTSDGPNTRGIRLTVVASQSPERTGYLTLFTSMMSDPDRMERNKVTLLNWDSLYPAVRPVLFIPQNDSNYTALVDAVINFTKHWTIMETPHMFSGRPILKGMFQILEQAGYDTPFVGYSNGDILFELSLVQTLKAILHWDPDITTRMALFTGRRRNVIWYRIPRPTCMECLNKIANTSKLFYPYAMDYFILSRAKFPWTKSPPHVIADIYFDNWLLGFALRWPGVVTIDCSNTINAIHQSGADGNLTGLHRVRVNNEMTVGNAKKYRKYGRLENVLLNTMPQNQACQKGKTCIPV